MTAEDERLRVWDLDPDEWPHTPPLDVWRRLYEDDDNWPWRVGIGHVVNVLDEALDRLAAAEAAVERVREALDYDKRDGSDGSYPEPGSWRRGARHVAVRVRAALEVPRG